MKKVFALLAIVGFVACNNAETPAAGPDTSSQAYKDSVAAAAAATTPVDTTKAADTTAPAAVDTTKK
jgi:hypothetical protein